MMSPERSLQTASGNGQGTLLRALEIVACCGAQLTEIVGAVVGQRVPIEPRLQIFDRFEVGDIGRKKGG